VRYGEVAIRPVPAASKEHGATCVPGPGAHLLPGGEVLEVDGALGAKWPLWWRGRRPGDRFHPSGRKGSKKLKAWLIDEKVPREARNQLWVLADDDGRVIWIPELGVRSENPSVSASLRAGEAIPDCAGGPPCYIDRSRSISGEAPGRGSENCASPTRPSCSGSS
jgi:tRNA(Ile)-lysidine synthetase-like protein